MARRTHIPSRQRRILGISLVSLGLGGDLAAGGAILLGYLWPGFFGHLPATILYAVGLHCLTPTPAVRSVNTLLGRLSGWTIAGFLIGILLFPGIGTLACIVAFLASASSQRAVPSPLTRKLTDTVQMTALLRAVPLQANRHVVPFRDVLDGGDTAPRRAVIQRLSLEREQESVQMLRRLLSDPDPVIRLDAGVVLTRIENEFLRAIEETRDQCAANPENIDLLQELGTLCERYASNGFLDEVSAQEYQREALDAYSELVRLAPARVDAWVARARLCHRIGDTLGAWDALMHAQRHDGTNAPAFALALEIAFRERRWDWIRMQARHPRSIPANLDAHLAWWAEGAPHYD